MSGVDDLLHATCERLRAAGYAAEAILQSKSMSLFVDSGEVAWTTHKGIALAAVPHAVGMGNSIEEQRVSVKRSAEQLAALIVRRIAEMRRQDAIRASRDAVLAQERAMADVLREAVGDAAEVETGRAIVDLRGFDVATLCRVGAAIREALKS